MSSSESPLPVDSIYTDGHRGGDCTRLFMNILEADKKDFGSPTAAMPAVMGADPTTTLGDHQAIADDTAGGFSSNLCED